MCDPGDNTTKVRRNTAKMSAVLWMGRVWGHLEFVYLYCLEISVTFPVLQKETAHCKNEKRWLFLDGLFKAKSRPQKHSAVKEMKVLLCTMKWNDQLLILWNKILELLFHWDNKMFSEELLLCTFQT